MWKNEWLVLLWIKTADWSWNSTSRTSISCRPFLPRCYSFLWINKNIEYKDLAETPTQNFTTNNNIPLVSIRVSSMKTHKHVIKRKEWRNTSNFKTKLTEQSACEDWTHPESSFLMQQAVSLSLALVLSICWIILLSALMHGANFAPKWIKSAALGPNLNNKSVWKYQNSFSSPKICWFQIVDLLKWKTCDKNLSRSRLQVYSKRAEAVTN